jgi:hypothetical protein
MELKEALSGLVARTSMNTKYGGIFGRDAIFDVQGRTDSVKDYPNGEIHQ